MGNDGVSELFPDNSGGGGAIPAPSYAYTETFKKVFPYYLSIGMSCDEFWNEDVELARFYREADRLRQERRNSEMWMQGLYVYEAVCDASPLFHDFVKHGTKPVPYREQPHELTYGKRERSLTKEEKSDNKAKAVMEMFMVNINRKFEKKGGEENGS